MRARDSILKAANVFLPTLALSLLLGCKTLAPANPLDHPYNKDYLAAVARAATGAADDQVWKFVHAGAKITLRGSHLTTITRVAESKSLTLAVLDSGAQAAFLFDDNGRYVGQLGDHGRKPGQYVFPSDAVSTPNGLALVDFTNHRVTKYTSQGVLLGTFIYGTQGFSATRLLYGSSDDSFILFGNRWNHISSHGQQSADLVHIYKGDGSFQTSSFQFPDKWLRLGLTADDTPITASSENGAQFFMLPFEYVITMRMRDIFCGSSKSTRKKAYV